VDTGKNYIISWMIPIRRGGSAYSLVVGMTGAKMGDRFAQIGCAHGGRLGAVASQVGLSGRAVAIVPDEASAERARKGAAQAGVLVDVDVAPPTRLPLEADAFDIVVIDDTGGLLGTMGAEDRVATVREALRILRPGGRIMVIGALPRGGLGALFTRAHTGPVFDPAPSLQADGFKSVRTLAERENLRFTEGIKPRS
jgi:ubiquinone/menaquinone biosynthesis C-methylase UbiE